MARNFITETWHFLRSYFSSYPSYCIFFITAVCNARCKHCFYWEEIGSAKSSKELKLEEIQKMADSMNLIYLSIGGGEPMIRPDLADVVKAFYDRAGLLYCNIVTNGFYVDKTRKIVSQILRECPRLKLKIQVSIDDYEKAHDENRKVEGIYAKAIETITMLSNEFRDSHDRFTLDVATCLTKSNKGHAGELVEHVRKAAAFDNYGFLYPRGNAEIAETKDVTPEEYNEAIRYLEKGEFRKNHNSILGAVHRVARRGILKVVESNAFPWPCLGGSKFINITEMGVLQPCEVLSQMTPSYDSNMATLRDHDFDVHKALDGKKAKEVVQYIKETKCRCTFECGAMNNVVFDKKNAARVIWTWLTGSPDIFPG
jgi:MoaA/NifB/PqqE/SkfB family radical SAM enzyme